MDNFRKRHKELMERMDEARHRAFAYWEPILERTPRDEWDEAMIAFDRYRERCNEMDRMREIDRKMDKLHGIHGSSRRFEICVFPSWKGTPTYADTWLGANLKAIWRRLTELGEVRIIDRETGQHHVL